MRSSAFLLVITLALLGCALGQSAPAEPTGTPAVPTAALSLPTTNPTPTAPEPTEAPTPIVVPERTTYSFDVLLDLTNQRVEVKENIVFPNTTALALNELPLVVHAAWSEGVFTLGSVHINGSEMDNVTRNEGVLYVSLPGYLQPGEAIQIELNFTLAPPSEPAPLSVVEGTYYLAYWYPAVPAYQPGSGWLINPPALVGEHITTDLADFHVTIRPTDAGMQIAAPGEMAVMVTGAHFTLEKARAFNWAAGNDWVQLHTQAGSIPVTAFVFPEDETAGQAALETAARALELYASFWGRYPFASLIVVETTVPDGLESDGLFFLDQTFFQTYNNTQQNYLTSLSAHETAHQWWYSQVGANPALEPWLDEALCTYAEMLYYERTTPSLTEWWWEFRANRFKPRGYVDSQIYDHTNFDLYIQAVYLKGALFLGEIRSRMGDTEFFAALAQAADEYRGGLLTTGAFLDILQSHSARDLSPIIDRYFKP